MNTRYASHSTRDDGFRVTEQIVNHVTQTMPLTHSPLPPPANYDFLLTFSGFIPVYGQS